MVALLLVEGCPTDAAVMMRALQDAQFDVTVTYTVNDARTKLRAPSWDLVLARETLPDGHGISLLEPSNGPPLVLVTEEEREALAIMALEAGALDCIVKDARGTYLQRLPTTLRRVLTTWQVERDRQRSIEDLKGQLERARVINDDLKVFASRVSHDVRAPLRRIRTFVDFIVQQTPNTSAEVSSLFDMLVAQVEELDATTKRLLEFSTAGGDVEKQWTDLGALIRRATERLSVERDACNASVIYGEMPEHVYGDPILLELVIQNLVANAIKYRAQERPPVISFSGSQTSEGACIVHVRDNGRGVTLPDAERLFAPFTRGRDCTEISGSGIGLSTCRRILDAHGGYVRFIPSPAPGACVEVCLPPPVPL